MKPFVVFLFFITSISAKSDDLTDNWIDAVAQQNTHSLNELFSLCKTNPKAHRRLSPISFKYDDGKSVIAIPTALLKSDKPGESILFFIDGDGPKSRVVTSTHGGKVKMIGLDHQVYDIEISTASTRTLPQIRSETEGYSLAFLPKKDNRSPECYLSGQNQRWQNNANLNVPVAHSTSTM